MNRVCIDMCIHGDESRYVVLKVVSLMIVIMVLKVVSLIIVQ